MPVVYKYHQPYLKGWAIAGMIAAVVATAWIVTKCGSTDCQFPERYAPKNQRESYQNSPREQPISSEYPQRPFERTAQQ